MKSVKMKNLLSAVSIILPLHNLPWFPFSQQQNVNKHLKCKQDLTSKKRQNKKWNHL